MSIESHVSISATFPDDETAKEATSKLKKSLKNNQHELATSLNVLNPVENQDHYKDDTINVEDLSRKKSVLSIYSYTYTSEEPVWFSKSLFALGANKIFIRVLSDGHGRNYYFLGGEKVPKKIFDGEKKKKPLSAKDIEINKSLFLPEGRVSVQVNLISSWSVGDIYESTGLEFKTIDGISLYYQGSGQLVDAFWDSEKREYDKSTTIEFSAAFERGRIENDYVSFVKRPTKIIVLENQT